MGAGIRAEVKIDSPGDCPIAEVSGASGYPSSTISKSTTPDASKEVTEEFILDTDRPNVETEPTSSTPAVDDVDLTEVFSYGSKTVYRFKRPQGWGCPCECLEQFDCPPLDVHTRDGALFLSFHAPDMDALQSVIRTLREHYPNADVQRLLRSNGDRTDFNLVFVDRSSLTDRQREVLETAHRMGYFDHPKGANAGEIADSLGITTSTFTEHLAAAQRKLLGDILDA